MDEMVRGVGLPGALASAYCVILLGCLIHLMPCTGAVADDKLSPLGEELTAGNAGLFVGVNDYPQETILPLKFSVNDAVAQAEMFVLRLKLVPARRCHLLLAGTPTPRYVAQLKALQEAGAMVLHEANRTAILYHLETVRRLASKPDSLLIVSFSGHGNEFKGIPYFIPSDGLAGLPSSFLALTTDVANGMVATGHQKRFLFIDACRLNFEPGRKGTYQPPEITAAFRQAFASAKGLVTLASCEAGQASLEDPRSESGVFTGKLLSALDGDIGGGESEFITMGLLSAYLERAVPKRASELAINDHRIKEDQIQHVWHQGPLDALDVPLAISPYAAVARQRLTARKLRAKMLFQDACRSNPSGISTGTLASVEQAIDRMVAPSPGGLLEKIETMLPRTTTRDVKSFLAWWENERRQQTVGPVTTKGIQEDIAPAPSNEPIVATEHPRILIAPLTGVAQGSAQAIQASFEESLQLPRSVARESIQNVIADGDLDSQIVEGLLREHKATSIIVGNFGEVIESQEKGQINRKSYDKRIWEIALTVKIISLDQGRISVRQKPFVGEASRERADASIDGRREAMYDAFARLKSDGGRFFSTK